MSDFDFDLPDIDIPDVPDVPNLDIGAMQRDVRSLEIETDRIIRESQNHNQRILLPDMGEQYRHSKNNTPITAPGGCLFTLRTYLAVLALPAVAMAGMYLGIVLGGFGGSFLGIFLGMTLGFILYGWIYPD